MGVRYLSLRTIGYDNVDVDAARELGLRVSHASYSPYSVANYTVMLMLMCMRKALYIMMRSHTADYSLRAAQGREMQNMTVGIIGTGKIGAAGLDVYEEENANVYRDRSAEVFTSVTSRLCSFPNVVMTSHQAFFTHEALSQIAHVTLENAQAYADGTDFVDRSVVC